MLHNSHLFMKVIKPYFGRPIKFQSTIKCEEIRISVPWGHIAGKWWGPTNRRPILTIHGWQDNCGTFNRLIPLLNKNIAFLAIDCPGQGLSSRIPSGLYPHQTDYLILIQYLVNYFNWSKVSLMGHSMGARISLQYAMLYPKNVDLLIFMDGLKPLIAENNIAHMSRVLRKFPQLAKFESSDGEPPSYTMEEIKRRVSSSLDNSVSYEHSHHLIERNVKESKKYPGKFYFTRDPRIRGAELMNWPQEDSVNMSKNVKCPIFVGKSMEAPYYEREEYFKEVLGVLRESSVDLQYHRLEGTHHLHLNNPEILAELINDFIKKHVKADGNVGGGLKEEMRDKMWQ